MKEKRINYAKPQLQKNKVKLKLYFKKKQNDLINDYSSNEFSIVQAVSIA